MFIRQLRVADEVVRVLLVERRHARLQAASTRPAGLRASNGPRSPRWGEHPAGRNGRTETGLCVSIVPLSVPLAGVDVG